MNRTGCPCVAATEPTATAATASAADDRPERAALKHGQSRSRDPRLGPGEQRGQDELPAQINSAACPARGSVVERRRRSRCRRRPAAGERAARRRRRAARQRPPPAAGPGRITIATIATSGSVNNQPRLCTITAKLQGRARERDQEPAQRGGQLAPRRQGNCHQRLDREQRGGRVEVAGGSGETAADDQFVDLAGRRAGTAARSPPRRPRARTPAARASAPRAVHGSDEHRREHEQVQQRAVAAVERIAGRRGPGDRQVRPGHVQRERAQRDHAGPRQRAWPPPAGDHDRGEQRQQRERAPVPGVLVVAAVVHGPDQHQRDHDPAGDQRRRMRPQPRLDLTVLQEVQPPRP